MNEDENRPQKHPGEENLIPVRSKDEARRLGAKGGRRSGEVRRQKKEFRDTVAELMENIRPTDDIREQMTAFGVKRGFNNYQMAVAIAALRQALNGNIRATEWLKNTKEPPEANKDAKDKATKHLELMERAFTDDDEDDEEDNGDE